MHEKYVNICYNRNIPKKFGGMKVSAKVNKIASKLEKINRANEELVSCLIDDFSCLDGFQDRALKEQVYKYAIAYFERKYIRSKSDRKKMPNTKISILLQIAIDEWRDAREEAERNAVAQIARIIFKASIQELRLVPDDTRVTAFKIVRNCSAFSPLFKYLLISGVIL